MSLSGGGLLCLTQEATVPKSLLVVLSRATVDGQKFLVLFTNATLKSPQLLTQGTMLLAHTLNLLLKGFDLPCISTETTTLSSNDALGVVL
jgi:hypothetical protein